MDTALLRKIGNMDQLGGIRVLRLTEGPARGMRVAEVSNAAGLRFSVLADRCMDLYDFSFQGVNFSFLTKNDLNRRPLLCEDDFFPNWCGGMMVTCGLTNVGPANSDNGFQPINGNIGCTPAEHFRVFEGWKNGSYVLELSGEMQEPLPDGQVLLLQRTIRTNLFDSFLTVEDTVINPTDLDRDLMLLYHMNFGYPLLNAGCRFFSPSIKATERYGESSLDPYCIGSAGTKPYNQHFHHTLRGREATAGIVNPSLHLGVKLTFQTEHLPYLSEWIHTQPHDYVTALEPCNCLLLGKALEREKGTLRTIPAYQSFTHQLKLSVLSGDVCEGAFLNE